MLAALVCAVLLMPETAASQETFVFENATLSDVITQIELETSFRFLYRDALISGRRISLAARETSVLNELREAVMPLGLDMIVDDGTGQVLLFALHVQNTPPTVVAGTVLDSESGARLPYATVSWHSEDGLRGAITDDAGHFTLSLPVDTGPVEVAVSYLGYRAETVRVDPARPPSELSVRLSPQPLHASEVIVRGTMLHTGLDTAWHHLMQPGALAPLGENGVLRSLQTLPSVSISSAVSGGLSVRGSRSDGFQVLLDGMPVYGQSHLFGLFDAFNEDAIHAVGFFYGVTPAEYQAPPGGTVSFLTRSGSRTRFAGAASVSNTSVRGTAEGPLPGGIGSWLFSGRRSIISAVDWMGNAGLVSYGLDLHREHSEPESGAALGDFGLIELRKPVANYYDLHAKLLAETRGGDQVVVSAYFGGDDASLDAQRILPRLGQGQGGPRTILRPADSDHNWDNATAGARWKHVMGARAISTLSLGYTGFSGSYERADFIFPDSSSNTHGQGGTGGPRWRIGTFAASTELNQWRVAESVGWTAESGGLWSAGAELNAFDNTYGETALERTGFEATESALQTDVYLGYATPAGVRLGAEAGIRGHHFGLGNYWGLSPRLDLRLVASDAVRLMIGGSRNYQFLYRITLEHEPAVDIWTLSGEEEKPTRVDYLTAGMHIQPVSGVFFQAEGYVKDYRNLRLHELTTRYSPLSNVGVFTRPWLWDASGLAKGLELMVRYDLGPVSVVHGYTRSQTRISHPALNGGMDFPAWWDRPHEGSLSLRAKFGSRVLATATWSLASGATNTLASQDSTEAARLPFYHRLDLTLSASIGQRGTVRFGLYNAYDRRNVWYRTTVPVMVSEEQPGRLAETENVDVYDLGIQPSLEITVRF